MTMQKYNSFFFLEESEPSNRLKWVFILHNSPNFYYFQTFKSHRSSVKGVCIQS